MRIGIVGGGAIGGYLAAVLSSADVPVVLVGAPGRPPRRPRAVRLDGRTLAPSESLVLSDDPEALRGAEVVLVTVKSTVTPSLAAPLAAVLPPETPVVSLQNGLHNATWLAIDLGQRVVSGVVSYNVFNDGDDRHQATAGQLFCGTLEGIGDGVGAARLRVLRALFRKAGERLDLRSDIADVMAGKLLMNLNNGICAATGLSITESLRDRDARWCFARAIDEGLTVMKHAGLHPVRAAPLPAWAVSLVLRLPDQLVVRLARAIIDVDPRARSSTLQDLDHGRATEIDDLNGAILSLAQEMGDLAPANATVVDVVRDHERAVSLGHSPAFVAPATLRERIVVAGG
ncbi:MAG: 2-dehydropantoate 2-reductase [Polyangiaceae bacterium]